jgi:hypothetical protein
MSSVPIFHIWELDQPHYLHAHGRAPHGHRLDPVQAEQFTALREQLITQTRYTDDNSTDPDGASVR